MGKVYEKGHMVPGQQFGKMTVVSVGGEFNGDVVLDCWCGNRVNLPAGCLLSGHNKSCGCMDAIRRGLVDPVRKAAIYLRRNVKKSAYYRGHEFKLSVEDVMGLMKDCQYCGRAPKVRKLRIGKRFLDVVAHGIDRVDSDKGYVPGNVVACCTECNLAKNDMTLDEFKSWLHDLATHQGYTRP